MFISGQSLAWIPKNKNRDFVLFRRACVCEPQFLPWLGKLPIFFKQLRGQFISKSVAGYHGLVGPECTAISLLEMVLELLYLGYPVKVLRSLIHSLPVNTAAILSRRVVRILASQLREMGKGDGRKSGGGNGGSSNGYGYRGSGNGGSGSGQSYQLRSRDRSDHEKSRKSRKRSSSSSSSASSTAKKTRSARKALEKHDEEFRKYLQQREQAEQEAHFKRQGELLANALNSKLESVIKPMVQPAKDVSLHVQQSQQGQHPQQDAGFSAAQLAQIKAIFESMVPQPGAGSSNDVVPQGPQSKAKVEPEPGKNSTLQKALLSSLFNGKVSLGDGEGLDELKVKIKALWSQRAIVEALGGFLEEHCDARVPKGKDERIKMFWDTLLSLR